MSNDPIKTGLRFFALFVALIVLATIALVSWLPSPLEAQTLPSNCAPRAAFVDQLARKYGESRKSMGLAGTNMVVEIFASDETGTWTIIVTSPDGISCLRASGQAFEDLAEALPNTDEEL